MEEPHKNLKEDFYQLPISRENIHFLASWEGLARHEAQLLQVGAWLASIAHCSWSLCVRTSGCSFYSTEQASGVHPHYAPLCMLSILPGVLQNHYEGDLFPRARTGTAWVLTLRGYHAKLWKEPRLPATNGA
jgi:hypothetical protein